MSMLSMVISCVGAWKAGVCSSPATSAPIPRKESERARTHQLGRAHLEVAALCTKTQERATDERVDGSSWDPQSGVERGAVLSRLQERRLCRAMPRQGAFLRVR